MKKILKVIISIVVIIGIFVGIVYITAKKTEKQMEEKDNNETQLNESQNITEGKTEKNKILEEAPEGATFFMPCYVKNTQKFDELNLKKSEDGQLYYTDFLSLQEYKELVEKLNLETLRDIAEYGENKEVAIIFKKTDKKVIMNKMKEEEDGLYLELSEKDETYGQGVTGMIIIINEGKYSTYKAEFKI